MPETKIVVGGFMGMEVDRNQNTVTVRFRDVANNVYALNIGGGYLGGLIVGLNSQAANLSDAHANQPMTLVSTRPFTMGDGRVGLMMVLDDSVRLPVLFPPAAIQSLRNSMDVLESHSSGGPPEPSRN
jgi:hypothetical protein